MTYIIARSRNNAKSFFVTHCKVIQERLDHYFSDVNALIFLYKGSTQVWSKFCLTVNMKKLETLKGSAQNFQFVQNLDLPSDRAPLPC